MNIAGEVKRTPLIELAFLEGVHRIEAAMPPALFREVWRENTGCEAFFVFDEGAGETKRRMVAIEEADALARLFDIDVIGMDGEKLTRGAERRCIVCGGPCLLYTSILNAARAAGIDAIDTVYSDVNNEEGFIKEARLIRQLGFDGKSVINPRQIPPLHQVFMPSEKDLTKARAVIEAAEEAERRGSGVISLNGKMIDKPIVTRARYLLDLAEAASVTPVEEV